MDACGAKWNYTCHMPRQTWINSAPRRKEKSKSTGMPGIAEAPRRQLYLLFLCYSFSFQFCHFIFRLRAVIASDVAAPGGKAMTPTSSTAEAARALASRDHDFRLDSSLAQ
jgi:hypothetical protein